MSEPTRQDYINGMRQICDFLESHPGFKLPYEFEFKKSVYVNGKEEFIAHARMLGTGQKSVDEDWFRFTRQFGFTTMELVESRSAICERVVVRTEEIESEEVDPAAIAALPKLTVKKSVEIVEWRCPDALLSPEAA